MIFINLYFLDELNSLRKAAYNTTYVSEHSSHFSCGTAIIAAVTHLLF